MEELEVKAKEPYKIFFGRGVIKGAGDIFNRYFEELKEVEENIFIISDKRVARIYLRPMIKTLKKEGFRVKGIVIPWGEQVKSIKYYHGLLKNLANLGATRDSLVVALGGGVIGDLSGFVASTYMRGCRFVQVPTTLLAQVDSSIGGKVGINLKEGKNLVGCFYSPVFVLIDPDFLSTLPSREFLAGFAEVLKSALIFNEKMFKRIYNIVSGLKKNINGKIDNDTLKDRLIENAEILDYLILGSLKVKREIVQSDEYEKNLRMILNFGHTFGHAIEKLTGYTRFLHGEAVILGMKIAIEISLKMGLLSSSDYKRGIEVLDLFEIPEAKKLSSKKILKQIESDKKKRKGKVNYILLKEIGYAIPESEVDRKLIVECIDKYL